MSLIDTARVEGLWSRLAALSPAPSSRDAAAALREARPSLAAVEYELGELRRSLDPLVDFSGQRSSETPTIMSKAVVSAGLKRTGHVQSAVTDSLAREHFAQLSAKPD